MKASPQLTVRLASSNSARVASVRSHAITAFAAGAGYVLFESVFAHECSGGPGCVDGRCTGEIAVHQDDMRGGALVDSHGKRTDLGQFFDQMLREEADAEKGRSPEL